MHAIVTLQSVVIFIFFKSQLVYCDSSHNVDTLYERTNGPVNAHLRPEIHIYNPRARSMSGVNVFSIHEIQSICQFTASFALQMTF